MVKLKLGVIPEEKPLKLKIEIPSATHRDLLAYAEEIARETGQPITDPVRLVVPMLIRFMATDRAFRKARCRTASVVTASMQTKTT